MVNILSGSRRSRYRGHRSCCSCEPIKKRKLSTEVPPDRRHNLDDGVFFGAAEVDRADDFQPLVVFSRRWSFRRSRALAGDPGWWGARRRRRHSHEVHLLIKDRQLFEQQRNGQICVACADGLIPAARAIGRVLLLVSVGEDDDREVLGRSRRLWFVVVALTLLPLFWRSERTTTMAIPWISRTTAH